MQRPGSSPANSRGTSAQDGGGAADSRQESGSPNADAAAACNVADPDVCGVGDPLDHADAGRPPEREDLLLPEVLERAEDRVGGDAEGAEEELDGPVRVGADSSVLLRPVRVLAYLAQQEAYGEDMRVQRNAVGQFRQRRRHHHVALRWCCVRFGCGRRARCLAGLPCSLLLKSLVVESLNKVRPCPLDDGRVVIVGRVVDEKTDVIEVGRVGVFIE